MLSPALVVSPLLPAAVRGSEYAGLFHSTDWLATFARLAGVAPPPGIDGVDAWDALRDPAAPHRTEALLTDHILRSGRWKLVTGAGRGTGPRAWRSGMLKGCMLGTGGGWLAPPNGSSNGCPKDIYTSSGATDEIGCPDDVPAKSAFPVTAAVDLWLCSTPCTDAHPCLWDIDADPREVHEVAGEQPQVVAALLARLHELQAGFRGATTVRDNGRFCEEARAREVHGIGIFAVPWIDDGAAEVVEAT